LFPYYKMTKTCASCLDFDANKVVKSSDDLKPQWLRSKDYVSEFIAKQTKFTNHSPRVKKSFLVSMKLPVGSIHGGKKILYWAARPMATPSLHVNDAKQAYGSFENSGVATVTQSGYVNIEFACPQNYRTVEKGHKYPKTYFRHVHFVVSNKDNTEWLQQIYTKIVVCNLSMKETIAQEKTGNVILVNSLPPEYYAKDHIEGSYQLDAISIRKMTHSEVHKWFVDIAKIHHPSIYRAIRSGKIAPYEIPVIVYCAHEKCDAGEKAIVELMKKGMVNVQHFPGGMQMYSAHRRLFSSIKPCIVKSANTRKNRNGKVSPTRANKSRTQRKTKKNVRFV